MLLFLLASKRLEKKKKVKQAPHEYIYKVVVTFWGACPERINEGGTIFLYFA